MRRARGLTQADLAERLGTHQPAVARLEAGTANPQLSTLTDIARALDATIRVELEPIESLGQNRWRVPWWEWNADATPVYGASTPAEHVSVQITANVNVFLGAPAGLHWGAGQARMLVQEAGAQVSDADVEIVDSEEVSRAQSA